MSPQKLSHKSNNFSLLLLLPPPPATAFARLKNLYMDKLCAKSSHFLKLHFLQNKTSQYCPVSTDTQAEKYSYNVWVLENIKGYRFNWRFYLNLFLETFQLWDFTFHFVRRRFTEPRWQRKYLHFWRENMRAFFYIMINGWVKWCLIIWRWIIILISYLNTLPLLL